MESLRAFLASVPLLSLLVFLLPLASQALWALHLMGRFLWRRAGPDRPLLRGLILATPLLLCGAGLPWWDAAERRRLLEPIPAPLEIAEIEYRAETYWGLGSMPKDGAVGFVVYRLTPDNAAWARAQGEALGDLLLRVAEGRPNGWRPTPVPPEEWSLPRHAWSDPISVRGYMNRYGYGDAISVSEALIAEADAAILNPGAFYRYVRGGAILVVAPEAGKVWLVYVA